MEEKKDNSKILIILIIIVILLIIFLSGFIFIFLKNNKGYKDKSSNNINSNISNELIDNKNDYIAVSNKEGKYGYIDTEGNLKIDYLYNDGTNFINGLAIVENSDYEYGIINYKGETVIDFGKYEDIVHTNEDETYNKMYSNLFIVNDDEKYSLLDRKGKVIALDYDYIESDEDVVYFNKDNNYGLLNENGKEIYVTNKEFEIEETENNITVINSDNVLSIIDNVTGKVILENIKSNDSLVLIDNYNGYKSVKIEDQYIIKDNKIIYQTENVISDINKNGIAHISNVNNIDEQQYVMYYDIENKKEILKLNNNVSSYLLDDKVVYQDGNDISYIDKNGDKKTIEKVNGYKITGAFGNSIIVENKNDLESIFNLEKQDFVLKDKLDISVITLTFLDYLNDYFSYKEHIKTDTPNENGAYYDNINTVIDLNGNLIYNDYFEFNSNDVVSSQNGFYTAYKIKNKKLLLGLNKDKKLGIIDINGKKIVDFIYSKSVFVSYKASVPYIALEKDNNIDIIDLENGKVVISFEKNDDKYILFHRNYVNIYGNFYNYNGKQITNEKQVMYK